MSDYDDDNEYEDEPSVIHAKFEAVNDDFILFDRIPIEQRLFSSPDLCAFALLDKRFPSDRKQDMVSAAEHDQIWLRVTDEQITTLTDDEILYLTRCGVMHDEEFDSLSMFV